MKKLFAITALVMALAFTGCPAEDEGGNTDSNTTTDNTDNSNGDATLSWFGNWIRNSDTSYTSNAIGHSAITWETLTIVATGGCKLMVSLTASSERDCDYGYVTKLDAPQSTSDYQLRVSGTSNQSYTYTIPAGTHTIHFGYRKDSSDSSGNDNVRVVVQFQGTGSTGETTLKIQNESSYTLTSIKWQNVTVSASLAAAESKTANVNAGGGYIFFTKSGEDLACRTQEVITIAAKEHKEFTFTNNTVVVAVNDPANVQTLGAIEDRKTQLTVKNESFTELIGVIWQDVSFANTQVENSIRTGTTVTKSVAAGQGYIFFKRSTNPIVARTRDVVEVAQYETKIFTFNDTTEIVEVNNTSNHGTLGSTQSTVVWFDDAERELQPYFENQAFVGYYTDWHDLPRYYTNSGNNCNYPSPKNGRKSIAVGGTNTAKMHLRVTLTRAARLSFWYANKAWGAAGTTFSINGEVKRTWTTDLSWANAVWDLPAGVNDIVWEKKDGCVSFYYYLTLDDILVYYPE